MPSSTHYPYIQAIILPPLLHLWRRGRGMRFTLLLLFVSHLAHADTYDAMRTKWFNFLTTTSGTVADVSDAQSFWNTMNKSAGRTYLWSSLTYDRSNDITTSFRRLNVMSTAYKLINSPLYNNAALKADIISALQWLYTNYYNENLAPSALPDPANGSNIINWWDFQIGTPLELNDVVTLLYDDLPATDKANYMTVINFFAHDFSQCYVSTCAGQFTGANRVWISDVIALRGVLVKDSTRIKYASDNLSPVFVYSNNDDGFYKDGSFVQHQTFAYTGGYGTSLLTSLTEELFLLNGTSFYPNDPLLANVFNWVYDSYAPIIFKGGLMSNTMGREISRADAEEIDKAALAVQAVALLATVAPEAEKARLKALVKQWVSDGGSAMSFPMRYAPFVNDIMSDAAVQPSTEFAYAHRQMANMDRVVQRTPGYALGISLYSDRMQNYEARTGFENIKGWHTGDGMTYLYTADTSQFNNDYWPTVDAYKLPGTTVVENSAIAAYKYNNKSWAGGASLLDKYGVTGWDYDPVSQLQSGKKAWFMFNGKIVCLGAAIITATGSGNVHTYIDQRKLQKDNSNTVTVNGTVMAASIPTTQTVSNATWAHVTGNVPNTAVGYYFPTPVALNMTRKLNTGAWADLNVNQNTAIKSNYYVTLWKNHGVTTTNTNSTANKYDYVLLPNYTAAQTQAYAANPDIEILQNTSTVQAVRDLSDNIVAANFYANASTSLTVGGISAYLISTKASSVIMKRSGDTLFVAVADPTMENTTSFNIALKENAASIISKDPQITVNDLTTIHFTANVNEMRGKSLNVVFKLQSASLPVKMGPLQAIKKQNEVLLNWQTITEDRTLRFDVQRSYNGNTFENIGMVTATGSITAGEKYTYTDGGAKSDRLYYRLKIADMDGKESYSNVVFVSVSTAGSFKVGGFGKKVFLLYHSNQNETAEVALFDMNGKQLYKNRIAIQTGDNQHILPLALAVGTYVVVVKQGNNSIQNKVIIK